MKFLQLAAALLVAQLFESPELMAAQYPVFDEQQFTRSVHAGMQDWQVPGMGVAVIDNHELVYRRGFGKASIESDSDVTTQTYFINASTTKAMVAAGLLILIDEGHAALDDKLIDHLPEIHFGDSTLTAQATLLDLLTHRTGLPTTDFWTFNQGIPITDQLPLLRAVAPVASLRIRKIYQNTMYELLGLVISELAGMPWEQFLKERSWRPIGMQTVATRHAIPKQASKAEPYGLFHGELQRMNHSLRGSVSDSAGPARSNIDDMARCVPVGSCARDSPARVLLV